MRTTFFLSLAVLAATLGACSGSGKDNSTPAPATVKIDSSGVVVDTTAR